MLFHVRLLAAMLAMFTKALLVKIKLTSKNNLACIFGLLTNPNHEGMTIQFGKKVFSNSHEQDSSANVER